MAGGSDDPPWRKPGEKIIGEVSIGIPPHPVTPRILSEDPLPDHLIEPSTGALGEPGTGLPGSPAYQIYLDLVNVGRRTSHMTVQTHANSALPIKTIDPSLPTRYAIVQVLTTAAWLAGPEAVSLLQSFGYPTDKARLRHALNRLAKRGLVAKARRAVRIGKRNFTGYNLTQDGSRFALDVQGYATANLGTTRRSKGNGGTQTSSKGSSGRTSSMCNVDPSKPTFTSAVKFLIAGMISAKNAFSAYDITKKMREVVTDLTIDTAETGTVHVGGKDVAKIEHDAVKTVVVATFQAGEMTGYDRIHNGRYFEYKPALVPFCASVPDPTNPPDPAPADPATSAATGSSYDGTPRL